MSHLAEQGFPDLNVMGQDRNTGPIAGSNVLPSCREFPELPAALSARVGPCSPNLNCSVLLEETRNRQCIAINLEYTVFGEGKQ